MPDLFPILRMLADRYRNPGHFLILGSASPHLMKNVSESLAGWIGFEIKYSDAPSMTKSMHTAIRDLHLDHLYVIYPGEKKYPIHDGVMVLPISELESVIVHQNENAWRLPSKCDDLSIKN